MTAHLLGFFGTALLLGLAPGPDNLFVLAQSLAYGPKKGLCVTLGLCSGLFAHTAAVALGVAAFFQHSPAAFNLLRWAGAAYLLYMAWGMFSAARREARFAQAPELAGWQLYRRGIVMNLCNPKVSIFFLAFLPQFVWRAEAPLLPQIVVLGALFILATLIVFSAVACAGGSLGNLLRRRPRIYSAALAAAALLMAALAVLILIPAKGGDGQPGGVEEPAGGIGGPVVTDGGGL